MGPKNPFLYIPIKIHFKKYFHKKDLSRSVSQSTGDAMRWLSNDVKGYVGVVKLNRKLEDGDVDTAKC